MSANPPKNDAWAPYKRVRFVLVRRQPWTAKPWQGLVLEWRKVGSRWIALVAYVEDEYPQQRPHYRMVWMKAEQLTPIPIDPNYIDRDRTLERFER